MPYAHIYWVKLKLELLNDKRFIFDCDSSQKWLFVGLILLAADTKNKVPSDENYLKNRLNLSETAQKVAENLHFILQKFPKIVSKDGYLKFKNFSKLHNPLKDTQRKPKGTTMGRIEVDKILEVYIEEKGWKNEIKETPSLLSELYERNGKAIKKLWLAVDKKTDLACKAIKTLGAWFREIDRDWTLETVLKHLPRGLKPICKYCKGKGKYTSATGYEVKCDCQGDK